MQGRQNRKPTFKLWRGIILVLEVVVFNPTPIQDTFLDFFHGKLHEILILAFQSFMRWLSSEQHYYTPIGFGNLTSSHLMKRGKLKNYKNSRSIKYRGFNIRSDLTAVECLDHQVSRCSESLQLCQRCRHFNPFLPVTVGGTFLSLHRSLESGTLYSRKGQIRQHKHRYIIR